MDERLVFVEASEGHGLSGLQPVAGVPRGVVPLDHVEGVDVPGFAGGVALAHVVHLPVYQHQGPCDRDI